MSGETAPEDVHTMAEPGSAAPAAGEPGKGKRAAVLAAKACYGCCCLLVLYVLFTILYAFTLAVARPVETASRLARRTLFR